MEYIFYLLQMITPLHFTEEAQKASVSSLQSVYESYNTEVAYNAKLAQEKACLVRIVFNESTSEPMLGKKMVAAVTVNRLRSGKFPDTICGNMVARGQYSFYNPKSKKVDKKRKYPVEYHRIAEEALSGKYDKLIGKSVLYFKNCSKYNSFFSKLQMVKKVGNHCFFREYDKLVAKN
jgi:spore germination cell wall hydrolase CwlJ-like protein